VHDGACVRTGHSYVYKSFRGRNDCFNVTSDAAGVPAAVLIRVRRAHSLLVHGLSLVC
jgi:3-methyladenine DNA glycosylase Mpg